MNFGEVIEAMKKDPSKRFARKGWNGKGMFIYLVEGRTVPLDEWNGDAPVDHDITINAHVDMKTADDSIIVGWLATQTDMLKEDWEEVI